MAKKSASVVPGCSKRILGAGPRAVATIRMRDADVSGSFAVIRVGAADGCRKAALARACEVTNWRVDIVSIWGDSSRGCSLEGVASGGGDDGDVDSLSKNMAGAGSI